MSPLRILIACSQVPLPDGSAQGRWCYALIRGLVRRGHNVIALAACKDREEADAASALARLCGFPLSCFPALRQSGLEAKFAALRQPFSYPFSPDLIAGYRTASAGDYDVLHIDGTFGAYLCPTRGPECEDPRTILHVQNLYRVDWPRSETLSLIHIWN